MVDQNEANQAEDAVAQRGEKMDLNRLETILRKADPDLERKDNAFRLQVGDVEVLCFTDPLHDRMRFLVPIAEAAKVEGEQWALAMEANFHTALDARYATSGGVLYSAFIHPLSPLTEEQVASGLRQTVTLALTFGTQYTAGELVFGGNEEESGADRDDLM